MINENGCHRQDYGDMIGGGQIRFDQIQYHVEEIVLVFLGGELPSPFDTFTVEEFKELLSNL